MTERKTINLAQPYSIEDIVVGDVLLGKNGDRHLVEKRKGTFVDTVTHFEGLLIRATLTYIDGELKLVGPERIPEGTGTYDNYKRQLTEVGIW